MPPPPLRTVGAWEDGKYVGVVIFGRGANCHIGKEYGLSLTTCCELVRIAMRDHITPVSRIIAIALRMLKKSNPGLRLVISFADSEQGHHGGIYQAGGWIYAGLSQGSIKWYHEGRWKHNRAVTSGAYGARTAIDRRHLEKRKTLGKHKYLMPLDDEMRKVCNHLAKPYPKRAGSIVVDAPPFRGGEGGAEPTPALHG
jgi:hypothetical protein